MNGLHWLFGLAMVSLMTALAGGQEQPKSPPAADPSPSVWMRKKLEYSQEILAGITMADFDKIAQNARAMNGLSKIEAFVRTRTPATKPSWRSSPQPTRRSFARPTRTTWKGRRSPLPS